MSLINDALKRANQNMKANPNSGGGFRLEPAHNSNPNFFRLLIVPLILVVLAGTGGWFLWKAKNQKKQEAAHSNTNIVMAVKTNQTGAISNSAPPPSTSSISGAPINQTKKVEGQKNTTPPKSTAKTTPPTQNPVTPAKETNAVDLPKAVVTVKPTNFPPIKLQAIFALRSKSSAMINNKPLFVGDSIDGVTVVAIETNYVTVEFKGYQENIKIPGK